MRRRCDVVVIGAGLVGLATARALLAAEPGIDVAVLEKEDRPAAHQSGRNSGVLHSGLYYRPGSAKARLVAQGRRALAEFAAARHSRGFLLSFRPLTVGESFPFARSPAGSRGPGDPRPATNPEI